MEENKKSIPENYCPPNKTSAKDHTTVPPKEDKSATHNQTISVLKWADSFLCLLLAFLDIFLVNGNPPVDGNRKYYVVWNGRDGICRLVPFTALRGACKRPTPAIAFLSHRNINTIFDDLLLEIFPAHAADILPGNTIVGALDSHSPSSSALERRLILAHRLNVPTDIFHKALNESLRLANIVNQEEQEDTALTTPPSIPPSIDVSPPIQESTAQDPTFQESVSTNEKHDIIE